MQNTDTVALGVELHPKQLISKDKFSGSRKFTLRYQEFEIQGTETYIQQEICPNNIILMLEGTLKYQCMRYLEMTYQ